MADVTPGSCRPSSAKAAHLFSANEPERTACADAFVDTTAAACEERDRDIEREKETKRKRISLADYAQVDLQGLRNQLSSAHAHSVGGFLGA